MFKSVKSGAVYNKAISREACSTLQSIDTAAALSATSGTTCTVPLSLCSVSGIAVTVSDRSLVLMLSAAQDVRALA